jgi:hypothetical protein
MSEQPNPTPEQPSEPRSWHDERQQRRAARRASRGGALVPGVILILLGLVFLLQNMGYSSLENWWALFILLPALGSLGNAWRAYQDEGRLNSQAVGSLFVGTVLLVVTAVLFFGMEWTFIGPVLIILAGIAVLATGMMRSSEN